ncbi:dual specificity phosphatase domain protein (macronuclear) [Tetrahymena thermophila SB210]|uniref:protein-tyrosine-phosphatase n=1 Tax=Tetrahymena thermophila (strain SB210) TaxID=312017 RepID=I7M3X1_TETTS|nr:dual specificity phosphatase domain protein [Tetrahymena thermophila SB210]EAS04458.2 dual specificity phosphatase domain protein [Tetrahymena thermophila SB210]|eukprot:XP_001024703.2 dual specificity phosphatase domain protein [Tetrahymena thermophila SB210]
MQVKAIQNQTLYNLIQDLRHIVLIQLSKNEKNDHLRQAVRFDFETSKPAEILELIHDMDQKAIQNEQKYKLQKIRRICFIDYDPLEEKDKKLEKYLQLFSNEKTLAEYKFYCLKEGLNSFSKKYPFLMLNNDDFENIEEKKKEAPKDSRDILNDKQKKVLYSYSQFPFEIVEDVLFLGNVYHSNSQMYLNDLSIKIMIDFITYSEEDTQKIPSFKTEKFEYKNIPLDAKQSVTLDFDEINKYIEQQISENKGRVLLYCSNGQSISPAFAISYLMYKQKMNIQLASMKVFALIGKVNIAQWIYTQLLVYKPKY